MNAITLKQYIQSPNVKDRVQEMLKDRASQFIVSLLSAANSNEALSKCDPASVLNAAMTAASLDLPINPNLGFAYIIPYKDKAQFQIGWKGFLQLAQRSGQFKTINVSDVRQGEITHMDRLTGEIIFEWLADTDRLKAPVVGYVGYMELNNGFKKSMYMTVEELKAHGIRFSQSMKKGYGLWKDDFDAMAKKTVIKLLLSKYAPLTTDMATAQEADQAIISEDNQYEYVDNKPVLAADVAKEKEQTKVKKFIEKASTLEELEMCEEFVDETTMPLFTAKRDKLQKVS